MGAEGTDDMGDCAACGLRIVAMPDGSPGCPYCATAETRELGRVSVGSKGRGVGAGVYTEREWALASPSQRVEILRRLIARAHVEVMEGDHAGAERTLEHAFEIADQPIPLPGDRDLSGELAGLLWGEARNATEATEELCSIRPGCAGRRKHAGPCCDADGNTLGGW